MKLKTKLTAAILGVSAAAFALCGTVSALSFKNYSLDTAAAGEREKLAIAGRAFRQVAPGRILRIWGRSPGTPT